MPGSPNDCYRRLAASPPPRNRRGWRNDALAIVTARNAFRALDLPWLKSIMAHPVLVDLRDIHRPQEAARLGFRYSGVGRATG